MNENQFLPSLFLGTVNVKTRNHHRQHQKHYNTTFDVEKRNQIDGDDENDGKKRRVYLMSGWNYLTNLHPEPIQLLNKSHLVFGLDFYSTEECSH